MVIRELRVFRVRKLTLSLVEHSRDGSRVQLMVFVAAVVLEHSADLNLVGGDVGRLIRFRVIIQVLVGLDRLCDTI